MQQLEGSESLLQLGFEIAPGGEVAHVHGVGFGDGARGVGGEGLRGRGEKGGVRVDEGEVHAVRAADLGKGQADAAGGAGDEGGGGTAEYGCHCARLTCSRQFNTFCAATA